VYLSEDTFTNAIFLPQKLFQTKEFLVSKDTVFKVLCFFVSFCVQEICIDLTQKENKFKNSHAWTMQGKPFRWEWERSLLQ